MYVFLLITYVSCFPLRIRIKVSPEYVTLPYSNESVSWVCYLTPKVNVTDTINRWIQFVTCGKHKNVIWEPYLVFKRHQQGCLEGCCSKTQGDLRFVIIGNKKHSVRAKKLCHLTHVTDERLSIYLIDILFSQRCFWSKQFHRHCWEMSFFFWFVATSWN